MEVFGLSGKAGTGKSFQAGELCAKHEIRGLIDDGLFLMDGNIAAGISAKRQKNGLAATKTALFTRNDHLYDVQRAIRDNNPERLLVIGTSDRMVEKICLRLEIPSPIEIFHIEDITTEEQREKARISRDENGMHIIPAPTMQVKKRFSGYFIDARRSFTRDASFEKTIIRPNFSYLGDYNISDRVIKDIVDHVASQTDGIAKVIWTAFANDDEGCIVRCVVAMEKNARYQTAARNLQKVVYDAVAQMTAFNVLGVEVEIRRFREPAVEKEDREEITEDRENQEK